MNLVTNTLTGTASDLIKTEIMYFVAAAKAVEKDLIKLEVNSYVDTAEKILKVMKREGKIQLFVFSDSLNEKTTETEYLKNKYPELHEIESKTSFFLIKP